MELQKSIEEIRDHLERGGFKNEANVRHGIVNVLLQGLGWPISDTKIVCSEYPVGSGRVDYALCHPPEMARVFIEAKSLGKVEDAVAQLFEYDSVKRVSIAVATDGQKWIFLYPTGVGTREERKVLELDLTASDIEENTKFFQEYLGYKSVQMGRAEKAIKREYEQQYLPKVWKELVEEKNPGLLTTVMDKTQRLFDFRPTQEQVFIFLKSLVSSTERVKPNEPWTVERFLEELLSSQKYKEDYESRKQTEKLCQLGTDLINLVETKQWELTYKFNKFYFAFYFKGR